MKTKVLSLLVAFLLIITISIQTHAEVASTAIVNTKKDPLNLWDKADGSTSIARIPKGATVTVLEKGRDWSRVEYQGKTGYARTEYLSFNSRDSSAVEALYQVAEEISQSIGITYTSSDLHSWEPFLPLF